MPTVPSRLPSRTLSVAFDHVLRKIRVRLACDRHRRQQRHLFQSAALLFAQHRDDLVRFADQTARGADQLRRDELAFLRHQVRAVADVDAQMSLRLRDPVDVREILVPDIAHLRRG